jgi:molybdopterin converting factor small subunit
VIVRIPSPLRSYTDQRAEVEAEGATIGEVLADLDRRYAGLRFRMVDEHGALRRHMRVFLNREIVRDLAAPVSADDELVIMQALSGGSR